MTRIMERIRGYTSRHFTGVLIVALFALAGSTYAAYSLAATAPAGPVRNGTGLCLDKKRNAFANSNPVQLYTCNGGAGQQWSVESDGTIRVHGFCLDAKRAGRTPMTPVQIYSCNGGLNQKWRVAGTGTIINQNANLCLDDKRNNPNPMAVVQLYTCNGGIGQNWNVNQSTAAAPPATTSVQPAPVAASQSGFEIGVVGWTDGATAARVQSLNAKVMRAEFVASASQKGNLEATVAAAAAHGVRVQPLIGWDDGQPAPDMTFLGDWARTYGPNGTYWAGKANKYPITDFELGNENSFYYKSGVPTDSRFQRLATTYGQRAVAAARAINAANPNSGVLVELDSDSPNTAWINNTLAAGGPDLIRLMHGPTAHPYGKNWQSKLDRAVNAVRAKGLTKPYYLTEWGISTDNGRNLSDNYDYPTNMTYDQAGQEFSRVMNAMAAEPGKVHQVMIYNHSDSAGHGASSDREKYFGLLNSNGGAKGSLTTTIRALISAHP